jgi:4-hydroxyacetophenone monooxygenase
MQKPTTDGRRLDEARLRSTVGAANLPTLLMVLFHLTGEAKWLRDPYRPSRSRGLGPNDGGGFSPQIAEEIRSAAVQAIIRWSHGVPAVAAEPPPALLQEMLSICMGEEVPAEYERLMREEILFISPLPTARLQSESTIVDFDSAPGFRVVVVGAGISGLIAAVQLRRLRVPFIILERNDDVGGVWLTNNYPGAGVDTPSYLYSFSFFQRHWSTHFGKRDEMQQYLQDMANYFDLRRDIVFNADVTSAVYHESAQKWDVTARVGGVDREYRANAVISAVGLFNKPNIPPLEGMDSFAGPLFHTAQWPADLNLTGKQVAVVGAGASAMQVVPAIADKVGQLNVFQRSPQWIAPNAEYFARFSEDVHWLMDNIPYYYPWYRFRLAWVFNDRVLDSLRIDPAWAHRDRSLNAVNDGHRRFFTRYITEQLEGHLDLLRRCLPSYPPFGKRMLLDNGWYAALKRPNVTLITAGVASLDDRHVITTDGQAYEADIVVMATGFQTKRYIQPMTVIGRRGRNLAEVWGEDDATAYLGITVPGFPNLFLMYGPNTNSGAGGSYFFIGESQCRYISDLIGRMVSDGIGSVDCRQDVHDRWVDAIDTQHAQMVWSHPGMTTYYRNSRGRVVVNSPYRMVDYWRMTHDADLGDYNVEPAVWPCRSELVADEAGEA